MITSSAFRNNHIYLNFQISFNRNTGPHLQPPDTFPGLHQKCVCSRLWTISLPNSYFLQPVFLFGC